MTTKLQEGEVLGWVKRLLEYRQADAQRLDRIYQYLRDPDISAQRLERDVSGRSNGPLRWLKRDVPQDVLRLAEMSRVNMLKFVVSSTVQDLYVDGYRAPKTDDEEPVWDAWQLNRMDGRQIAVHRAALSYGAAYVTVLPGDSAPVIRPSSPRKMTAVYGDEEDWPELALETRRSAKKGVKLFRLYDADATWWVEIAENGAESGAAQIVDYGQHGLGFTPVVRFVNSMDEDEECPVGEVEPLFALQDQINVTTFGLLVAQHYAAFRQRYIIGWTAADEKTAAEASARKLWTFEDEEVKVGEFGQTDLSGYINSREASLRHLATISQTPAHELLGQLVNLSAEALAAAERSHRAKVTERQVSFGESWEQVLELAGNMSGAASDLKSQVRWRDTEARSLSTVADALGKLVAGLGVPPQELWERIPGVSQMDVERWKATASNADAITQLTAVLERQANPANPANDKPAPDAPAAPAA